MKRLIILLLILIPTLSSFSQNKKKSISDNSYIRLIPGSEKSGFKRIELFSDIDTSWNKWKLRGYNYGFNPGLTPMYTTVNGILSTPYMIQVRGNEDEKNRKRWGYHVFEGYAKDDISRITMLVNKHTEEEKPVAEMYYYGAKYGHSDETYNWFRIGSDVRQHSFMFSRDKAIFYGSLKLTNALTLGNIGKDNISSEKPQGDDETNYKEDSKHVNYKELKKSGDGTIFYDKDNHIVVIKIDGKWMKLAVEPLPENIKYDF
jgi:hypothetical protein